MKMKIEAIFLLFCFISTTTTLAFPTKPLNERSTELAWQAWLLVDDQNQNNKPSSSNDPSLLRRRITPKSVFIAPTFSPESLPACADGYRSDAMGRCIKIIKLDEAAHLDFLLKKLNEQFGDYEEDEMEEQTSSATQGPLQLNIPLNGNDEADDDNMKSTDEDETDVAIVVAPTNGHFFPQKNLTFKLDVKRNQEPETTTSSSSSSSGASTITTETSSDEEMSTLITETEPPAIRTTTLLTTGDAIFFLDPVTSGTTTQTDEEAASTITTLIDDETTTILATTTAAVKASSSPSSNNPIRFSDVADGHVRFPEATKHQTRDTLKQFVMSSTQQQQQQSVDLNESSVLESHHNIFNHRNREKHNKLFLLPPQWSESSPQKPLVLRFSRKHGYMDTQQLNHPNYYRELQGENLSYIFGFKQNGHR